MSPATERIALGASLVLVCALAWVFTVWQAQGMEAMQPMPWRAGHFAAMFLMWVVMMVAMMLPGVFPMVFAFASISRQRRAGGAPYAVTAFFVAGYLIAWSAYSAAATVAQWGLEQIGLLDFRMQSTSGGLTGGLFLAAGLYQWTTLKEACLVNCRSPAAYLFTEWRDGRAGAIIMGLKHGAYCVGCCAVLMALLFAVAVMDVVWVATLTVVVVIEKLLPGERFWRHAIGAVLTLVGVAWILRAMIA